MTDRLRPRDRQVLSGFTKAEIEKMERLLTELGEQLPNREHCQKIAQNFNRSSGRAGKPVVKWTEVHNWFHSRQSDSQGNKIVAELPKACSPEKINKSPQMPEGGKGGDLSELEFEARSSKDGAWYRKLIAFTLIVGTMLILFICLRYSVGYIWYDVDMFLTHRFLSTGEAEARVRFVGFGAEEDEWVNIKMAVRERSLPLEHSECHKVKEGDLVLCFQERRDQAIYYDAHVLEIQRRMHDIRGCRCLFLVRYDHDNTEEKVHLRRLCRRPTY